MSTIEESAGQKARVAGLIGDKLESFVQALDDDISDEAAATVLKLSQAYATLTASAPQHGRRS